MSRMDPLLARNRGADEARLSSEQFASQVATWEPQKVAEWAKLQGFDDYTKCILHHEIRFAE